MYIISYIYYHGVSVEDWALGIIISLKKKENSTASMDNMRGVHILSIFRQWYCRLLIPRLETVARRVLPDEQQGFRPDGRIYASFLSLYSLFENARLRKERLFVCFIDTQKAFPSVRRDCLLHQLAAAGAEDELIRALHVLYADTKAAVRTADGFGDIFQIFLGTREGGR